VLARATSVAAAADVGTSRASLRLPLSPHRAYVLLHAALLARARTAHC